MNSKNSKREQNQPNKTDLLLKELHSFEGKLAEGIADFSGSMNFVYFHIIWFLAWVLINIGLFEPLIPVFDPFPYGLLTMIVSLEAIFLATFILINQNRQAIVDEVKEIEEEKEQQEEEEQQEELEEEVEDIQKDLDQIKNAIAHIQNRITKNQNGTSQK